MKEPRSPVTPTALHSAEKEKRAIALDLLAKGPRNARAIAIRLPPSVGARSSDPLRRRREVAGALLRALAEEGLAEGPDATGYFRSVQP